jgi:hypothetical protein
MQRFHYKNRNDREGLNSRRVRDDGPLIGIGSVQLGRQAQRQPGENPDQC